LDNLLRPAENSKKPLKSVCFLGLWALHLGGSSRYLVDLDVDLDVDLGGS
jgi:hypothetical protein